MAVFMLIASSRNSQVITVKMNMPAENDMNLPGQKAPPKPCTTKLVASMNNHVIGTPNNINIQRHVFAHSQINGPFTCTQTKICPNKNKEKDKKMYL